MRWGLLACGLALFVVILFVRGGPPPTSVDTASVVQPTTDLSRGHLAEAARQSVFPQPPGYPLFAAPFVVVFRPLIGSPTWCSDKPVPKIVAFLEPRCSGSRIAPGPAPPRWYRSQALLGILAWAAMAAGAVSLLRAAGAGGGLLGVGIVGLLAALPAASNALIQSFHPQDLLCVGLICAGMGLALRRRWMLTGAAFGAAYLCKQFAVLPLIAVLVAVPGWRERAKVAWPAALVVVAGVLPFVIGDASQTLRDLADTFVIGQGSTQTGTVVGLLHISGSTRLALSRDLPIVTSFAMSIWARSRVGRGLLRPGPLMGLCLACLATRLVFEVTLQSYYLLAVSTGLLASDLSRRRLPWRSFGWVALSSAWLAGLGLDSSLGRQAAIYVAFALGAVAIGLLEVQAPVRPRRV